MASVRWYTIVYVALVTLAVGKFVFFELFDYWIAMSLTLAAAVIKTTLIAGYYQHLRTEPRSVTYLVLTGLGAVLLLAMAASFSIL